LQSTAVAVRDEVEGEPTLAYGVGRGGSGFLGGHVLVVTEGGVRSVPAKPWGAVQLSNFLRFEDVEHFRFGSDFISVEGARDRFKMKKCPPDQIAALGNAIRDGIDHRLSSD